MPLVNRFIASLFKITHCYASNILSARGLGGLLPKAVKTRQHWILKMTKRRGNFQIKPFRYSRKGFPVRWSELELVNEVKRQTDGIALEMRRVSVWPVTAHAVVPAEFSAADHVCPEGIIRSEGRRAQSVLLVLQTVSTPVVEGSIGSLGVIETTVELH